MSTEELQWKQCWTSRMSAAVCCEGIWGAAGCWEDGRNYDSCCRAEATVKKVTEAAGSGRRQAASCQTRLSRVAGALGIPQVRRALVDPVEARVAEASAIFNTSLSSGAAPLGALVGFLSSPSALEQEMLLALTLSVSASLKACGVTYFALGGTLIGALRHYGPIPWDDDVTLGTFGSDPKTVADALLKLPDHASFGPIRVTEITTPSCVRNCNLWSVSFAKGILYGTQKPFPSVDVDWFDPGGTSSSWQYYFGAPRHRIPHREVLTALLPVTRQRPFGNLRLPVPSNPWLFLDMYLGAPERNAGLGILEKCQSRNFYGTERFGPENAKLLPPVSLVPCASLAGAFPMVLLRRSYATAGELLAELGDHARPGRSAAARSSSRRESPMSRDALAAAGGGSAAVARLKFSVEVAADAVRGAHVLLVAEEAADVLGTAGMCWTKIYGEHDIILPALSAGDDSHDRATDRKGVAARRTGHVLEE